MAKIEVFKVKPIFSLNELPEEVFSKSVLSFRKRINESLKKSRVNWNGTEQETPIVVLPLPEPLRSISGERTMEVSEISKVAMPSTPAPTPFILGLFNSIGALIVPRIADALIIETLAFPNKFSFPDNLGRESQLCARRSGGRLMLDVSEYIKDGVINYAQRYSGTAIKSIFYFVEDKVEEDSVQEQKDHLSEKMIG